MKASSSGNGRSVVRPGENLLTAFADRVGEGPDRPAVRDAGTQWTYRQLDRLANGVARQVFDALDSEAEAVGVLGEHDAWSVAVRLGIQKAGHVVVCLDPIDPEPRTRALIAGSDVRLIVADAAHKGQASQLAGNSVPTAILEPCEAASPPVKPAQVEGGTPCGVIHTSGSTGEPKGVIQTHRNVLWNARNYAASARLGPGDRMTLLTRGQFAAASSAIYGALLHGACLLPFDPRRHGFREMRTWLEREAITVYHSVPTLFRRFCESLASGVRFPDVRLIKLGGEPVMNYDIRLVRRHFGPECELLNGLGMTEASGNVCHFRIGPGQGDDFPVVPVGFALPGVEIAVLDEEGRAVPTGESGEIAFRSRFVAPGYWKAGGFGRRLADPPPGDRGAPFLRTGDLGRLREDGCLEHLGRSDRLTKIRGVRVDPSVVEAAILEHPAIGRCAVAAFGEGSKEKRLAAFVVASGSAAPDRDDLRAFLAARLPASQVPTWIRVLEDLPLTPGGKTDYQSLPAPVGLAGESADARRTTGGARDGLEMALTRIWEKVLKVPAPGPEDDFFDLGGDSLLSAVMLSRVEAAMKVDLPLTAFWQAPTIAGLARLVRRFGTDPSYARLAPIVPEGERAPFFAVPAAGVDVAALKGPRRIRWGLRSGRPIHAMQYRGIDGVEEPHETVEEMAAALVEEIRNVQPHGPYHLGGFSFGGFVAFEAARQLRRSGEETALLVLVDTRVAGHAQPRADVGLSGRVERALIRLLPVGEQVALTREALRGAVRQARYRSSVPIMRWWCSRRRRPLPKVYRFYALLNRAVAAKQRYEVRPYDGPVTLLRAEEQAQDRLYDVDPTLGWGRFCPQLEILDLPGGHGAPGWDPATHARFHEFMDALLAREDAPPSREADAAATPG